MSNKRLSEMRSVSLTPEQARALDSQASKESRKVGNMMRVAVCKYLVEVGALRYSEVEDVSDDED